MPASLADDRHRGQRVFSNRGFDSVALGAAFRCATGWNSRSPQSVTLTNQTASAIALNMIATGGNYSSRNNCGTSLAGGASCQISVTSLPFGRHDRWRSGNLHRRSNNPLAIELVGSGLAPQIHLPCCFYFWNQVIGTQATQTGSVNNTGQAPLTISSIIYSGPSDFTK